MRLLQERLNCHFYAPFFRQDAVAMLLKTLFEQQHFCSIFWAKGWRYCLWRVSTFWPIFYGHTIVISDLVTQNFTINVWELLIFN
jgi:hypothetical protein